jgi:hypothetical protein
MHARDWDGLGQLLADDFVLGMPNTRLRIRGRKVADSDIKMILIRHYLLVNPCTMPATMRVTNPAKKMAKARSMPGGKPWPW